MFEGFDASANTRSPPPKKALGPSRGIIATGPTFLDHSIQAGVSSPKRRRRKALDGFPVSPVEKTANREDCQRRKGIAPAEIKTSAVKKV